MIPESSIEVESPHGASPAGFFVSVVVRDNPPESSKISGRIPTRCLIEWQLLTLMRPSEAAGSEWSEIDLNIKLWTISAARMKKKRENIVPLSPQALEILDIMKPLSAHREHVFPSRNDPKQPMNSQTANATLKRIGYSERLAGTKI